MRAKGNLRLVTALLALTGLLLVGCSGSDSGDGNGSPATVEGNQPDGSGDAGTDAQSDSGDAGDEVGADNQDSEEPTTDTGTLPEGFPADLTPPDGTTYQELLASLASGERDGKRYWFVRARVPGELEAVVDDIQSQLESAGYDVTKGEALGIPGGAQSDSLTAESDEYRASIVANNTAVSGAPDTINVDYDVSER